MKIESTYPDLDLLARTLHSNYHLSLSQTWNGQILSFPEELGEGIIHIYKNKGLQFMRGNWKLKSPTRFVSPDPVGTNELIDFRIGVDKVINSAYLEGQKHYDWDITNVNGMRFFFPKSLFTESNLCLIKKFQQYCYHPQISTLVSEILNINPQNFQESIKLEWKFLEFAYYYIDFLNNKDIARHFTEIPQDQITAVNKVRYYLDENYREDIKIEDLAKIAGINIQYLKQRFKQVNDCTIRQYQIKLRMQNAREFILYDDAPVSDICLKVGYFNRSYFIKTYKKIYGITPLEDRYAHRNNL